ncbi:hypothetical protein EYF80_006197 [Liparis tanakae]|uniref:Uncharacterized protein n=1 Tax=Liparis tanakae TaxID=230148 RepID=A0A4Z2J0D9_9TELE|nr:hypothetical protein EYF80_006197 [Liparis tanakae]
MKEALLTSEEPNQLLNLRLFIDFVTELFKNNLKKLPGAHRAPIPKPAATSTPRSILVSFLQFCVKELILKKVWQRKIESNGKQLLFDNDDAPANAVLKEKGIRYQMPDSEMRVYRVTGRRIYKSADEAARDLNEGWDKGVGELHRGCRGGGTE